MGKTFPLLTFLYRCGIIKVSENRGAFFLEIKALGKIESGQDGAIFGDYLFRFSARGMCKVYDVNKLLLGGENAPFASFKLECADIIAPHSNAVSFSSKYYAEGDEFPLLYTNIYNNYAKCEDRLVGVCCVYRILREGDSFSSRLVQLIEIGFNKDELWLSSPEDVRPYGNFLVDREKDIYYAFVMRDGDGVTRYFSFDLPPVGDGDIDGKYAVRRAVLTKADIKTCFDAPYHKYIQGACCHGGLIYSLEGFTNKSPAIRIINPSRKEQEAHFDLLEYGLTVEPEFIDFHRDRCIYSDADGGIFELIF